jgi:hypothetical protein
VNLNGWFASVQFDFNNTVSLAVEADNYCGSLRGIGMPQQNFIVSPQFTFGTDRAKFRPFIYPQGGDQRSASSGSAELPNVQEGQQAANLYILPSGYSTV